MVCVRVPDGNSFYTLMIIKYKVQYHVLIYEYDLFINSMKECISFVVVYYIFNTLQLILFKSVTAHVYSGE